MHLKDFMLVTSVVAVLAYWRVGSSPTAAATPPLQSVPSPTPDHHAAPSAPHNQPGKLISTVVEQAVDPADTVVELTFEVPEHFLVQEGHSPQLYVNLYNRDNPSHVGGFAVKNFTVLSRSVIQFRLGDLPGDESQSFEELSPERKEKWKGFNTLQIQASFLGPHDDSSVEDRRKIESLVLNGDPQPIQL